MYKSEYPIQDDDHVKATTRFSTSYWQYFSTDPTKPLIGAWYQNQWVTESEGHTNQRFHIDLGSGKIIKRIYYENSHDSGGLTTFGAKDFTFWGSNIMSGTFDDLVYGNDGGWTELTVAQNTLDEHINSDEADPKYIIVTNDVEYQYYAFKFANTHGGETGQMGVRRLELQIEGVRSGAILFGDNF